MTLTVDQVKALPVGTKVIVNRIGAYWLEEYRGKSTETIEVINGQAVTVDDEGHWDSISDNKRLYEGVPQ